jgi:hypothetical protein
VIEYGTGSLIARNAGDLCDCGAQRIAVRRHPFHGSSVNGVAPPPGARSRTMNFAVR